MEPLESDRKSTSHSRKSEILDSLDASQVLIIPSIEQLQRVEVGDILLHRGSPAEEEEEESSGSEYVGDVNIGHGYGDDVDLDVVRAAGNVQLEEQDLLLVVHRDDHRIKKATTTIDLDVPSEDYFEYQFDPEHFPNLYVLIEGFR